MNSVYPLRVDGKVIIVTGGYGHLGAAITKNLLYHGGEVIVGARDEKKFHEVFNEENDHLGFVPLDIESTESIKKAFAKVFEEKGKIDCVINNAVFLSGRNPENMTDEEWSKSIDGTLSSAFRCMREIFPYFKKMGKGNIINVSSMYGVIAPNFSLYNESPAFLNPPHYGAAKAGLLQLSRYYASYYGKQNIRVNSVTPGPFPSPDVQKDAGFLKRLSEKTLLGRTGIPEDLAGIFTFLTSDASGFITGQNFIVDGGWTSV